MPSVPTTITAEIAQLVEHDVANVEATGSNPVFRSKFQTASPWRGVREVEGTALEMRRVANHSPVGSNPTLAARTCFSAFPRGPVAQW